MWESRGVIRAGRAWCAWLVLYVTPVAWLATEAPGYAYWVVSAVGFALWTAGLAAAAPHRKPVLACAIASLTTLVSIPLAVSLYIQGTGFNEGFFFHADASSLAIAWQAYRLEVAGVVVYWATITAAPLSLARASREIGAIRLARPVMACTALTGVLAYAPAISLVQYAHARVQAVHSPILVVADPRPPARKDPATAGSADPAPTDKHPNLVMIVAESLEATFGNPELVGADLTPALTALEREGLRFTNMIQIPAASWTMGGIVASQCAAPLDISDRWHERSRIDRWPSDPRNTMSAALERPLPHHECLGDILLRHGYRNIYFTGSLLAFAGKRAYFSAHGFEEQYGWLALRDELPRPDAVGPWGIHDDALFDLAWKRIESLSVAGAKPFALVLSTIDTHDVTQRDVSRSCGRAPLIDAGEFTIRCADRLIADFIAKIRAAWPDMVVVLMSDHLSFPNPIADRVTSPQARRLRFAIWAPGLAPREIARPGTHFDIASTVLEVLGFTDYRRHHLGASLLSFDSPWLSHDGRQALRAVPVLLAAALRPHEPIVFENTGPIVRIDGERILANRRGFALDDAVFTLRFHDDGRFDMALPWQTFDDLAAHEAGSLVVGLSTNAAFNRAAGAPEEDATVYFAGRVGAEAGLAVGTVGRRTEIELPRTSFEQTR